MDLPSSRELELETLLRLRDTQLTELTDELTHLRQSLSSQPGPSSTEPVTLPPALVSILSPHLHVPPTAFGAPVGSNTVNAALTQRARALQEENDEMYELLKVGETGKLKEEVRGLRRVVARLEGALRESHQVIANLSTELDKSYSTILTSARPSNSANNSTKSISQSPRAAYHPMPPTPTENGPTHAKPPPTGPRAHKKPRLSEPQGTPPHRSHAPLPPQHKSYTNSNRRSSRVGTDTREYPPRRTHKGSSGGGGGGGGGGGHAKMEIDEDQRARPPSPEQDRTRERERERDRDRDRGGRDREPQRDGYGSGGRHRRNGGSGRGNFGGGGSGAGGGGGARGTRTTHDHGQGSGFANDSTSHAGDRTLRERMGL